MLDKTSAKVQQQIKDGIIRLDIPQYALALTTSNLLDKTNCNYGKRTTYICDRCWHDKVSPVKANRTVRLKLNTELLAYYNERLDKDDFIDTVGAEGPETFQSAASWRETFKDLVADLMSERWFIVYHDDKYVYDYETKQPIQLDQTPYILTDTTIFN